MFGMGKSTTISIVNQFLKAIRKHKNLFIKFPVTKDHSPIENKDLKLP